MIDFHTNDNPVLVKGGSYGGWDADALAAPSWCYDGTRYVMVVSLWSDAESKWASAFFTSPDMAIWTYVPGSLLTPEGVNYIRGNGGIAWFNGEYWINYNQYEGYVGASIWVEKSSDLVTWELVSADAFPRSGPDSSSQLDPSLKVNPNTGNLETWYIGSTTPEFSGRSICMAYSEDGETWTKAGTIFQQSIWDAANFGEPDVAYGADGRIHLVWDATILTGQRNLGYAASDDDGATWQTYGTADGPRPWGSFDTVNCFDGAIGFADLGDGNGNCLRLLYAGSNAIAATDDTQSDIGYGYLVVTQGPDQSPDNLQWNQSTALETLTQYDHWLEPDTGAVTKTVTTILSGDNYPLQPENGRAYRAIAVAAGIQDVAYFESLGL